MATPDAHTTSLDAEASRQEGRLEATIAVVMLVAVTAFHYLTDASAVEFHNVYRRLYYVPIVLAAFSHGLRGGLMAGTAATLAYLPHAFLIEHRSPSPAVDKFLEMVLYVGIGGLTGWLVDRQRRVQRALETSLEERDALEEHLVRAEKLSALGQLTSGLAHEIRNPLASIMGSAETLVDEFDEDHRKYRMGQVLLSEIDRLNQVVEDFLEFARPGEPEPGRADLYEVAVEVEELTGARARDGDIEVEVELEANRWLADADPSQLSQVALNLLLNAYQAIERHDVADAQRFVRFHARERNVGETTYACLGVTDGAGELDSDQSEQVFDPYFTTRDEGTGLGLSVSSRIAEAHDGFIDVETSPDATTFWVCVPAWQGGDT
jgi:signal transduction histidine kinase